MEVSNHTLNHKEIMLKALQDQGTTNTLDLSIH